VAESYTVEQWRNEGQRRFGPDHMQWRFVCPSCGHVASVQDWNDAGATESEVAFSCIGRWTGQGKKIFNKPGPCNYAGGGLFRLNPVLVKFPDGSSQKYFDFDEAQRG